MPFLCLKIKHSLIQLVFPTCTCHFAKTNFTSALTYLYKSTTYQPSQLFLRFKYCRQTPLVMASYHMYITGLHMFCYHDQVLLNPSVIVRTSLSTTKSDKSFCPFQFHSKFKTSMLSPSSVAGHSIVVLIKHIKPMPTATVQKYQLFVYILLAVGHLS